MKKTDEMKQEINAKRAEVERLQQEQQIDAAVKAANELNKMVDEYNVQKAIEDSDFENFVKSTKTNVSTEPTDKAVLRNRAFNKLVFGRENELTEAEREAYYNVSGSPGQPAQVESIPSKGGYLVPTEQRAQLQEYRKNYVQLKEYVTVVQTETTSGRWPTMPYQQLEFQTFAEMTDIPESDMTFSEATYVTSDRALIVPVSRQLAEDADVNIIEVVGRQLAEGAVYTENKSILTPLQATYTSATTITSHKNLNTALFKDLDGVYYNNASIYTNQSGMLYLSNLEDGNNRPLLQPDVTVADTYRYRGKPIVVIPNSTLPNIGSGANEYAPFFVGDMRQFLYFFERQGMTLETSYEHYWRKHGIALKGIIRFGTVVYDANAMITLKVKV